MGERLALWTPLAREEPSPCGAWLSGFGLHNHVFFRIRTWSTRSASGFCLRSEFGKNPLAERVDHAGVDSVFVRNSERIHSRSEWTTIRRKP